MSEASINAALGAVLEPGAIFADKYKVVGKLGAGNFAYVLKARHDVMEREVALKLLKPEMVDAHADVRDRFLTEVKIVSRLRHPNTVTIYDFGETPEGFLFMVLEYVDGVGLDEVLGSGALEPSRVGRICKQILKSLDEAHSIGIVHRDLKPSNIMLTDVHGESDYVKVLDFGVAKLVSDSERITRLGDAPRRSTQFIGTPVYMSPEQVLGREVVPASDVYSLGLILYEMLTGDSPVDTSLNVAAVAQLHIDDAPLPFSRWDSVPQGFRELIRKATARHPEDRFPSVREFARALPRETLVDITGEFKQLVEADKDVFGGKNYVDIPDSDVIEEPASRARRGVDRDMLPARPRTRSSRREELQLDVGKLKRAEIHQRTRERSRPESTSELPETREIVRRVAIVVAGLLSVWASFAMLTALSSPPILQQLGVFVAHLVGATVWTQFSTVRSLRGGVFSQWILPTLQNSIYLWALEVACLALIFPAWAASRMTTSAAFVDSVGVSSGSVLGGSVVAMAALHRHVFDITAGIVPWA